MAPPSELRRPLIEDGYCVAEDILDDAFLPRLRRAVEPLLLPAHELPDPHFGLITDCQYKDDAFADLIAHPPALQLLQEMGFRDNRWMSFYLIDKLPHSISRSRALEQIGDRQNRAATQFRTCTKLFCQCRPEGPRHDQQMIDGVLKQGVAR